MAERPAADPAAGEQRTLANATTIFNEILRPMQATPSTTTLQRSHESLEHFPDQPKDHVDEGVSDSPQGRRLCEWASTFWCTLESNYPRVTRRARQFLLYMKGPRPVIDLPGALSPPYNAHRQR